ncbi:mucin-2-like [Sitodiplosis mosellana]|uniref:mucin-2-like n=1 Tax=Sitodiplosis mosellana TaxID=263140 RepID=UPI00244482D9|nr:mucin-2-like [Sitodiplosis mosellana]
MSTSGPKETTLSSEEKLSKSTQSVDHETTMSMREIDDGITTVPSSQSTDGVATQSTLEKKTHYTTQIIDHETTMLPTEKSLATEHSSFSPTESVETTKYFDTTTEQFETSTHIPKATTLSSEERTSPITQSIDHETTILPTERSFTSEHSSFAPNERTTKFIDTTTTSGEDILSHSTQYSVHETTLLPTEKPFDTERSSIIPKESGQTIKSVERTTEQFTSSGSASETTTPVSDEKLHSTTQSIESETVSQKENDFTTESSSFAPTESGRTTKYVDTTTEQLETSSSSSMVTTTIPSEDKFSTTTQSIDHETTMSMRGIDDSFTTVSSSQTTDGVTTPSSITKSTMISGIDTTVIPRGGLPDSLVTERGHETSSVVTSSPIITTTMSSEVESSTKHLVIDEKSATKIPITTSKSQETTKPHPEQTLSESTKQPKDLFYNTPMTERMTTLASQTTTNKDLTQENMTLPKETKSFAYDVTTTESSVTEPSSGTNRSLIPSLRHENEGFDDHLSTSTGSSEIESTENIVTTTMKDFRYSGDESQHRKMTENPMFTDSTTQTSNEFTTLTTEQFVHEIMTEAAQAATDDYIRSFTTEMTTPCDETTESKPNYSTKVPDTMGTTINPFTDPKTWTTIITSEKMTTSDFTTFTPQRFDTTTPVTNETISIDETTTPIYNLTSPSFNQSCTHNTNCTDTEMCINFECVDPCSVYNPCIPNVPCITTNHEIRCQCDEIAQNSTSIKECKSNPEKCVLEIKQTKKNQSGISSWYLPVCYFIS